MGSSCALGSPCHETDDDKPQGLGVASDLGFWVEPPVGIEPTTFSLRGGPSASHSPSSSAPSNTNARTTLEFHHEFPGFRTTSCTTAAADESARPLRLIVATRRPASGLVRPTSRPAGTCSFAMFGRLADSRTPESARRLLLASKGSTTRMAERAEWYAGTARWDRSAWYAVYDLSAVEPPPPCPRRAATTLMSRPAAISSVAW